MMAGVRIIGGNMSTDFIKGDHSMYKVTDWIRRHQVLAFFILAYAITWPLLFLYYFGLQGNPSIGALLEPLVVFSPALMAMLISGIAEPAPKQVSSRSRWIAFTLAWLFSAPILILYAWKVYEIELMVAVIVYSIIAFFPAWVLSSACARTPGIRKQFSTLLKPRGPAIWYLVVFLIFPGFQFLDMGITMLLGNEIDFKLAALGVQGVAIYLALEFLKGFLLTGGINEESGWRGFALPRLQARYPVIVAAGIVWFFWAFWHLPYDIGRGIPIAEMLVNRLFRNLVVSILMTWLYNRTKGSILAPALFHPAMNTFGNNLPGTPITQYFLVALAVFAFLFDRMWKKLPSDHLAVYRTPEFEENI
jgi:membrane protease YdiL (CAAX protease family)